MIYYLRVFILNHNYRIMGNKKQSRIIPEDAIKKINNSCKHYFDKSNFLLKPNGYNIYIISTDGGKALNNYKNTLQEVKVLKWFEDFWLYIEIEFRQSEQNKSILNTFISLSVFQGKDDENKAQLFRAEWDNFDHDDRHPQPHWHIYSDHNSQCVVKDFVDLLKEDKEDFQKILEEEKLKKSIDIKRFHFAMNGDWANTKTHTHKLTDEETIINWFQGLLNHIKYQLEEVSKLNTNSAKLN
jgi:hypothetical protein